MYPDELESCLKKFKAIESACYAVEELPPHHLTFLLGEMAREMIKITEILGLAGTAINVVGSTRGDEVE